MLLVALLILTAVSVAYTGFLSYRERQQADRRAARRAQEAERGAMIDPYEDEGPS
jgi:hypothetical protein